MHHRPLSSVAAAVVLLLALSAAALGWAAPSAAASQSATSQSVGAQAWILVDADSGVVLDAQNASAPRLVASTTKLLTALVVARRLAPDQEVLVSERAAAMPARKLDLVAGSRWQVEDLLYGLLLSSANDAGAALAEASGGSLEAFGAQLQAAADELGLQDLPTVADPSGLDDADSIGGGNMLSPRDLAIVARAVLADPLLARIVATTRREFVDPTGRARSLGNHNKLLATYPGTIGMKTGYTSSAGQCLVAAATRNGRTLISVVLGAASLYGDTTALLDRGFAMAPRALGTGDRLPEVVRLAPPPRDEGTPMTAAASTSIAAPGSFVGRMLSHPFAQLLLVIVMAVAGLRTRVRLRQARRQRVRYERRARAHHPAMQPGVAAVRPRWGTSGGQPGQSWGQPGARGGFARDIASTH